MGTVRFSAVMVLVVGVAKMAAGIIGYRGCAKEPRDETTIMLPENMPLVLARIPAGTFMMGRHENDQDSDDNEYPQHQVTILQDFYMGKYEITQQQWLAVMDSWPDDEYMPNADRDIGNSYPAYFVSWDNARNFIVNLNEHIASTEQGPANFRLPSEAEW